MIVDYWIDNQHTSAIENRVCKACGILKDISEFRRHTKVKDGRRWRCRDCCAKEWREWYAKQSGRRKAYMRAYCLKPRYAFSYYKANARKRELSMMTFEEFMLFWKKECSYCGVSIAGVGIDRVDSAKGYSVDNCVPCCGGCNAMKSDMTLDEFLGRVSLIYANRVAGNTI